MDKQLQQLQAALTASGEDFMLLSPLPKDIVHVRFIGAFERRTVVWDMHLYTLARYALEQREMPALPKLSLRGLIHIERSSAQVYRLEVALKVPIIDQPTIKKAILMMRNYRKLQLGLHAWGEEIS